MIFILQNTNVVALCTDSVAVLSTLLRPIVCINYSTLTLLVVVHFYDLRNALFAPPSKL